MQRLKRSFRDLWEESQVRLWGYTKIITGSALTLITLVGQAVNDPGVKEALGPLQLPAYVTLGLAVLGFITLASNAHSSDNH